jgi:hypothetical protein
VNKLPILIIGFIRVEGVERLLNSVKPQQVSRIYLSLDGPRGRVDFQSQNLILSAVRDFCRKNDIPLDVWKRRKNLGVAVSVISSIDWFFSVEGFGIILEDDLILGENFFDFVAKSRALLESRPDVLLISGNQHFQSHDKSQLLATHYPQIWGWATTSQKWKEIRLGLLSQGNVGLRDFLSARRSFWTVGALRALRGKIDTWDIPLARFMIQNRRICLLPPCNLVSNFGFDQFAIHTQLNSFPLGVPTQELNVEKLNYQVPADDLIQAMDTLLEDKVFNITSRNILSLPKGLLIGVRQKKGLHLQSRLEQDSAKPPKDS